MTTEITTWNRRDIAPSLPALGLQLLAERVSIRMETCPFAGRRLVRPKHPPLTDGERDALEQTAVALSDWLAPGDRTLLIALLARLANHRSKERSPQQWQMLFEDYVEDLGEFSTAHIQEAIKEHRRSSTFFPASAELRAHCVELVRLDKSRLEHCERLLANE